MNKAKIIDGIKFATDIRAEIKKQVSILKEKHKITPGLAVVLVGENPASQIYVRNKVKMTVEVGMNSFEYKLPANISQEELIKKIKELNDDDQVNGILIQLPLPKHIEEKSAINAVTPKKDVDGFHVLNAGLLATGQDCTVPCTPLGCIIMLKKTLGNLTGLNAVVIGRSNIVGKPMAQLLLKENCTVTLAHSRTKDLEAECRRADIVVSAVGVEEMVRGEWIKPGATVIDVGINRAETSNGSYKLVGDVNFDEVSKIAGHVTPVPGGVGPMTIACLLKNTLELTCKQHNIKLTYNSEDCYL